MEAPPASHRVEMVGESPAPAANCPRKEKAEGLASWQPEGKHINNHKTYGCDNSDRHRSAPGGGRYSHL